MSADQAKPAAAATPSMADFEQVLQRAEDLAKVTAAIERRYLLTRIMLALLLLMAIINGYGVLQIRSCTEPNGRCHQAGEARTTAAVQQIITQGTVGAVEVAIAQRSCLQETPNPTDDELRSCIFGRLAAR